jgi:hypothetical protein
MSINRSRRGGLGAEDLSLDNNPSKPTAFSNKLMGTLHRQSWLMSAPAEHHTKYSEHPCKGRDDKLNRVMSKCSK